MLRDATTFSELLNDILEETRRRDIFLASCGPSVFRSISRLIAPKDLNDLSFSDLVSKMKTGASKASSSQFIVRLWERLASSGRPAGVSKVIKKTHSVIVNCYYCGGSIECRLKTKKCFACGRRGQQSVEHIEETR